MISGLNSPWLRILRNFDAPGRNRERRLIYLWCILTQKIRRTNSRFHLPLKGGIFQCHLWLPKGIPLYPHEIPHSDALCVRLKNGCRFKFWWPFYHHLHPMKPPYRIMSHYIPLNITQEFGVSLDYIKNDISYPPNHGIYHYPQWWLSFYGC